MIRRKEIMSVSIKQDNDARCFNSCSNDQRGGPHNKRAKRLASKRVRRFLLKELKNEFPA